MDQRRKAVGVVSVAAMVVVATMALVPAARLVGSSPGQANMAGRPNDAELAKAYARVATGFEANLGQAGPEVKFLSRHRGSTLLLGSDQAVLSLGGNASSSDRSGATSVVTMKVLGADRHARVAGLDALGGLTNYIRGADPARWHTGVKSYAKVRYGGIYPGIDLVYSQQRGAFEYDFIVAPGADPTTIGLGFTGASAMRLDPSGDLVFGTGAGEVRHHKPVIYQRIGGKRRAVAGAFVLGDDRVGFRVGRYDTSRPLVIDPVLSYFTYLGGGSDPPGVGGDEARGIAVDSSGNAYVTGITNAANFPTAAPAGFAAYDTTANGDNDVFVAKLNSTGSALVYSTYLGGSGAEEARGIVLDGSNNAYVTGSTASTNFPTAAPAGSSAYDASNTTGTDAFVAKLNSTGSALVYSTYLGADNADDVSRSIAVDSSGNAYVTGNTASSATTPTTSGFPTTAGAYDASYCGPGAGVGPVPGAVDGCSSDAFVTKLNSTGSGLSYSSFLGGWSTNRGGGNTRGSGIALADSSGKAYVTGATSSSNFPTTTGAYRAVAYPGTGALPVLGSPLPVLGGTLPASNNNGSDAFVAGFDTTATGTASLLYSTYLGGSGESDAGLSIAARVTGSSPVKVYVAGITNSPDFPTLGGFQLTNGGGTCGSVGIGLSPLCTDGFVTALKLDNTIVDLSTSPSDLLYSTYLGGSGAENAKGAGITLVSNDNVYLTGTTSSTDFPTTTASATTTNALQATTGGSRDAYLVKINTGATGASSLVYSSYLGGSGSDLGYGVAVRSGDPYVAGSTTSSSGLATTGAYDTGCGTNTPATCNGGPDAFVAKFTGI